ncbi:MAG TPA: ABC transporter permease, partial [Longimicrobiales bacterium]|nr:ABC transporter permease [Longimicrobiales bacterium]
MKLLRALLRILPAEFRREYGEQLLRTARDQWEALPSDLGPAGRARFWARQAWAVVRAAVVLRRRSAAGPESRERVRRGRRGEGEERKEDLMDGLWSDLKHGARALAARPGYTAVAVLTLSLGIGATTAMFSAVNSVLLRPLPYRSPERVVTLFQVDTREGARVEGVSAANVRDLALASERLSAAAVADPWSHDLMVDGRAVSLRSWAVSEGFFRAIGTTAHLGRVFTPDEYRPDAEPVVLMSYATWQSRFGGDPEIVGGTLVLDDAPRTVVGVLPPGFEFPGPAELWSPRPPQPYDASHRVSSHMQG